MCTILLFHTIQMHKCLYLLCPTDGLETIIDTTFRHENYYYTSLANSLVFDYKTLHWIKEFLVKNNIKDIQFVLSKENQILSDALGHQFFSKLKGLDHLYNEIDKQYKRSKVLEQSGNCQFLIISYYLNKKIAKLQLKLNELLGYSINIRGKVYDRHQNTFVDIYSNLICLDKYHLN